MTTLFLETLFLLFIAFGLGLLVAWFIWGRLADNERYRDGS
jgi:hypothetical protein